MDCSSESMIKSISPNKIFCKGFHHFNGLDNVFSEFDFSKRKPDIMCKMHYFTDRRKKNQKVNYCLHKKKFHVYKYTKICYLEDILFKRKIAFPKPTIWEDPFEALFYVNTIHINDSHYNVACMCVKYDWVLGEEAAWKSYGDNVIRVEYDFNTFVRLLNLIGKNNSVNFYISIVDYCYNRDELKSLKKYQDKKPYNTIEEYLTRLSLKRMAFAHECELRIFAVKKNTCFDDEKNGIVFFDIPEEITLYGKETESVTALVSSVTVSKQMENSILKEIEQKCKIIISKIYSY